MRTFWLLLALTCAALLLRLYGIDHSVPHSKEADAHMALHVELIRAGATEPDPNHNDVQYPIILPGLLSLVPDTQPHPGPNDSLDSHLSAAAHVYVETRIEMALFGVLAIPLTFLLARRFLGRGWSSFAAAMIAVSFLHQSFAQQARPHAAAATVFLLAVLAAMRLARRPDWKGYAMAFASAAVAIGTLQSGLSVLLPLFVAMHVGVLRVVHEHPLRLTARLVAPWFAVPLVAGLAFAVFYPFLHNEGAGAEYGWPTIEGTRLVWADHNIDLKDWRGQGFATLARTMWFYEPLALVLLLISAGAWFVRKLPIYRPVERWSDFWVAASFALPYLIAVGLFRYTFERFLLPLLPYIAVCAAWGLAFWAQKLSDGARRAWVTCAVLALGVPLFASTRLAWLRAGDDTLERTADWIAAQPDIASTPVYIMPFFDLPLARSRDSLDPSDGRPRAILSRWSVYQKRRGADELPPPHFDLRYLVPRPDLGFPYPRNETDTRAYLQALGPGYFVLDMSLQPARAGLDNLRAALRENGPPVFRSAPEDEGSSAPFGFPLEDEVVPGWPNVFRRALRIQAVGPVVEVFRLR